LSKQPNGATRLAGRVRVCTYDRLNVGRSDSDAGRHTGADSVRELHALLDAAAVPGPYLLVGFSFGGLLAIMYAGTYPDQVTGLVSLDGSLPTDDEVDQLIPTAERAQVAAKQVQFTKAVPKGRLVEVQSSHDIDLEKPELVVQEINRILEA
jgi:pimeloyl-ACP methyl ester carboxylesterase